MTIPAVLRPSLLGLPLLVGVLFSGALFSGRVFFERDIHAYWYPHIEAFVHVVSEGSLPTWNPYPAFGRPLAADPNFQIAYPLTWLNLVLQPATYFKLFVIVHCLGAGWGLERLCRRLGLGPWPSLLAAGSWVASGPFLSSVSLFHHFAGAAWMPWVLLALDGALRRGGPSMLGLGAVAAGQALAGSADMCFMTALLAAGYSAVFIASGPVGPRLRRVAAMAGLSLPLAAALAAIQWLPALALLRGAVRPTHGSLTSLYWSLHPVTLLDLWISRLTADFALSPLARAVLFESREPLLRSIYLGAASALVVLWGLAAPGRKKRVVLCAAGFVFFVLAALGRHTPLLPALLHSPPFGLFRYPPKYLLPASLLWAALTGLAAEATMRPWDGEHARRARWVFGLIGLASCVAFWASPWIITAVWQGPLAWMTEGGAIGPATAPSIRAFLVITVLVCAVLWLRSRWSVPPSWLAAILVAVVLGDLVRVGRNVNSLAPPELLRYRPRLVAEMSALGHEPRIYVVTGPDRWRRESIRYPADWQPLWGSVHGAHDLLQPPLGGRWRVQGSYDGDFTGLAPLALSTLTRKMGDEASPLALKLLQMGSVDYVVALHAGAFGGLPQVAEVPSVFTSPIRLFRVPNPVPRAYAVGRFRAASESRALAVLQDPSFDPHLEVILPEGTAVSGGTTAFRGSVRELWRRSTGAGFETDFEEPGLLVVVEALYPGWKATVDDHPAELLLANLLFRAVRVGAGRHRVALSYRAPGLKWGALLSGYAACAALAFWEICRLRSRRPAFETGASWP